MRSVILPRLFVNTVNSRFTCTTHIRLDLYHFRPSGCRLIDIFNQLLVAVIVLLSKYFFAAVGSCPP